MYCVSSDTQECVDSARKILLLLLHHLPMKCQFNIVTFGGSEGGREGERRERVSE